MPAKDCKGWTSGDDPKQGKSQETEPPKHKGDHRLTASRQQQAADAGEECTLNTVGQPYEGKPGPREPGPRYNFRHGFHTLTVFLENPTDQEVELYRNSPITLGFWADGPIIWAVFHLDGLGWQDAPYTPHLVEPEGRILPQLLDENSRYPLTVTLADSRDGTVQVIRVVTLSPELSRQVREETEGLLPQPHDQREYEEGIQRIYLKYASSDDMRGLPPRLDLLGQP